MNKNKLLVTGLTVALAVSNVMPVLAVDTQSFNENGSADILVNCEIESGYTVILPAAVTLEKTDSFAGYNYGKEFKIGVQGNIDSDKMVTVQAKNDSFEMKAGSRTVNFDVTQANKEWSASELGDGSEKIEKDAGAFANITLAGNYSGEAEFEFFLGEGGEENNNAVTREAGLYKDGVMVKTWDELVAAGLNCSKQNYLNKVLDGDLIISDSVTEIANKAFYEHKKLNSVTVPGSVKRIGQQAFRSCYAMEDVDIMDGVETIDSSAFAGSTLKSIKMTNSVKTLGASAFYNCTNLSSAKLSNQITTINDQTFCGCSSLESIEIPEGVTSINMSAFNGCKLKTVKLPNSVTTLGYAVFANNDLTSIDLGTGLTFIGEQAFSDNPNLTSIVIPDSVTRMGERPFYNSGITSITYRGVEYTDKTEFNNKVKADGVYTSTRFNCW